MKSNIEVDDEEYIASPYEKEIIHSDQFIKNPISRKTRQQASVNYKEEPESDEEYYEDNSNILELFEQKGMGIGVRAKITIPAACTLGEYRGKLISESEARTKMCNSDLHYIIGTDLQDRYIDAEDSQENKILKYINHKCENCNCELVKLTRGRVAIQTRRQIQPQEPLDYNYQMIYFEQVLQKRIKCLCTKECQNFF
jgi:SET domain